MCILKYRGLDFTQADYECLCGMVAMLESRIADSDVEIMFGDLPDDLPKSKPKPSSIEAANHICTLPFARREFPEVIEALCRNNKIEAVKIMRERTGGSLKEALDIVNKWIDRGWDTGREK